MRKAILIIALFLFASAALVQAAATWGVRKTTKCKK